MMLSVKKCAVALVIVSATIVASLASPTDVELDKEDNILVVRVTEDQQQQRERQERRLDSVASAENTPVTIEIFEEKEARNGGEIVEKIEVQGHCSEELSKMQQPFFHPTLFLSREDC